MSKSYCAVLNDIIQRYTHRHTHHLTFLHLRYTILINHFTSAYIHYV